MRNQKIYSQSNPGYVRPFRHDEQAQWHRFKHVVWKDLRKAAFVEQIIYEPEMRWRQSPASDQRLPHRETVIDPEATFKGNLVLLSIRSA